MALPKLKAPVVLVHGFLGFDQFSVGTVPIAQYFPGIPQLLRKAGNRVVVPWLSATRGVAERAKQLKKAIEQNVSDEPVHLIAHSMGGLDARYMIARLDMADRVLTLTTLGTPHRGTPFADWGVRNLGRLVRPLLEAMYVPTQAFFDLTTEVCAKFDEEAPDAPNVRYFSIAGEHDDPSRLEWCVPYQIVFQAEGPNDGVVSVKSATYGKLIATRQCDHLALVGWNNGLLPAGPVTDSEGTTVSLVVRRLEEEGY